MDESSRKKTLLKQPDFLPMSRKEMDELGWDELDFLFISGDAYVDHPSFAAALLGRLLIENGFRTGVITQPDWTDEKSIMIMGRPKLMVGISAGALDSMLAAYTAFRKKRAKDAYTPGGLSGKRPNRAVLVYSHLVRKAFPAVPIVIGGIEASLRRCVHYDFWENRLRRSIILDAKADLLIYGMGERALLETVTRLNSFSEKERSDRKFIRNSLTDIRGTVYFSDHIPCEENTIEIPSFEDIKADPSNLIKASLTMEKLLHKNNDITAFQKTGDRILVYAPPASPLNTKEMDKLYSLPFRRFQHPSYTEPVPAASMIFSSITSHRGCASGCTFCSLAVHQGRMLISRSSDSILNEATKLISHPDFKGHISDIGGPSANMWGAECTLPSHSDCKKPSCLHPVLCNHFKFDFQKWLSMLKKVKALNGVKSLRISSGFRFDLALKDKPSLIAFLSEFVGGQLKIAPEHLSDKILNLMRKPSSSLFEKFLSSFNDCLQKAGKEQYVIPYLMSAFPGCTDNDMEFIQAWLSHKNWKPQQVQCFIPTPGTVASAMFYAERDTKGNKIFVAKTDAQRLRQHGFLLNKNTGKNNR